MSSMAVVDSDVAVDLHRKMHDPEQIVTVLAYIVKTGGTRQISEENIKLAITLNMHEVELEMHDEHHGYWAVAGQFAAIIYACSHIVYRIKDSPQAQRQCPYCKTSKPPPRNGSSFMGLVTTFSTTVFSFWLMVRDALNSTPVMRSDLFRTLTFMFPCKNHTVSKYTLSFVQSLAKAGFYHDNGNIQCYCCGLRKNSWSENDSPIRFHKDHQPQCEFISKNADVNIIYMHTTEEEMHDFKNSSTSPMPDTEGLASELKSTVRQPKAVLAEMSGNGLHTDDDPARCQNLTKSKEISGLGRDLYGDKDAAKHAIEKGWPRKRVTHAVLYLLTRYGPQGVTKETILNLLDSKEKIPENIGESGYFVCIESRVLVCNILNNCGHVIACNINGDAVRYCRQCRMNVTNYNH